MMDVDGDICPGQRRPWPTKVKFGLDVSSLSAANDVWLRWQTSKPLQGKEYGMEVKRYIGILMWSTYGQTFDHDSPTSGIDDMARGGSSVL